VNDWYRPDSHALMKNEAACHNPQGPAASFTPGHPLQPERVIKGGSFLCSPEYSEGYRPSARRGSSTDTGMSHLGFRCALTPPAPVIRDSAITPSIPME